jgi:hypothetical protein
MNDCRRASKTTNRVNNLVFDTQSGRIFGDRADTSAGNIERTQLRSHVGEKYAVNDLAVWCPRVGRRCAELFELAYRSGGWIDEDRRRWHARPPPAGGGAPRVLVSSTLYDGAAAWAPSAWHGRGVSSLRYHARAPGARLGRYQITAQVGAGGGAAFGTVGIISSAQAKLTVTQEGCGLRFFEINNLEPARANANRPWCQQDCVSSFFLAHDADAEAVNLGRVDGRLFFGISSE